MLSQFDRQQLELISNRLQIEDPEFAKALREWRPRPPAKPRRWPVVVIAVVASVVFLAGLVSGTFSVIFLGAATLGCVAAGHRHLRRWFDRR